MLNKWLFYRLALQDITMDQTGGHPGQLCSQEILECHEIHVSIRLVSQQLAEQFPLHCVCASVSGNTGNS